LEKRCTRSFVLSRAFFAGSQRYGAIWTGDNSADWKHLRASVPMLLSIGIAGLPFAGADVGGFFGNPEGDLMVRWYQAGAFQPFFRGHAHLDTKRREPWLKGEPYTTYIREAIRTRYTLLPLWYSLFHQSSIDGTPVMRPLFYEFPNEEAIFDLEDEYLIGNQLLVKPIVEANLASTSVYLPGKGQIWYRFDNLEPTAGGNSISVITPLNKIPVFIRGGSIIPKKERVRRSSSLMANDPYTLLIALDSQGQASGEIYFDDGISFNYKRGQYVWKNITMTGTSIKSESVGVAKNTLKSVAIEKIIIVGLNHGPSKVVNHRNDHILSTYHPQDKKLILKKPKVFVNEDWHIQLKK